ncbi:DUF3530 family protein [Pseudomonas aeruginosa]|uniref:DUF3530 family protein n=1 Tax=Pseudomonas aeruginosa TaxID=287 RepID=UPI003D80AA8E
MPPPIFLPPKRWKPPATTGPWRRPAVYYQAPPAPVDRAAKLRHEAGKRQKHPAYVQIAMQALPADPKAEQEQLYQTPGLEPSRCRPMAKPRIQCRRLRQRNPPQQADVAKPRA